MLVLERRTRLGGACTLEQPFPDPGWRGQPVRLLGRSAASRWWSTSSACAAGATGSQLVDPHLWCPLTTARRSPCGTTPTAARPRWPSCRPRDVDGYEAYEAAVRPHPPGAARRRPATTVDRRRPRPSRSSRSCSPATPRPSTCVFEASIADVVEHHVRDERLRTALHGQGIIGTCAGPRDPGTAAVHLMHASGTLEGRPGAWGYVDGGMGRVSFALADAAIEAGAVVAAGVARGRRRARRGRAPRGRRDHPGPGRGVQRRSEAHRWPCASTTFPTPFGRGWTAWRSESPVLKINCGLSPAAPFSSAASRRRAAPGHGHDQHRRRRHPGRLRGEPAGRARPGLVRAVLPDRLRPVGRARRAATS